MATSAKRMSAYQERERRGLRWLTIGVSENDLCVIAEHGYEGAASTGHDQQAQAVSLFVTDMLAASIDQGNGVTTLKRRFSNGVTTVGDAVSVAREIVSEQFRRRSRARRQVREHPTAVLDRNLELVALKKGQLSS